ncbi:hypothetical protein PIB30_016180 [Stylosanthes scabra]|uniref:Uncharacterized protein n=1 Tax=Stylosanthes scabra TaxID=79078 RepID=A0ABU6U6L4_9FABA|nr:hypothetical protein [Stylosanthes scabra]
MLSGSSRPERVCIRSVASFYGSWWTPPSASHVPGASWDVPFMEPTRLLTPSVSHVPAALGGPAELHVVEGAASEAICSSLITDTAAPSRSRAVAVLSRITVWVVTVWAAVHPSSSSLRLPPTSAPFQTNNQRSICLPLGVSFVLSSSKCRHLQQILHGAVSRRPRSLFPCRIRTEPPIWEARRLVKPSSSLFLRPTIIDPLSGFAAVGGCLPLVSSSTCHRLQSSFTGDRGCRQSSTVVVSHLLHRMTSCSSDEAAVNAAHNIESMVASIDNQVNHKEVLSDAAKENQKRKMISFRDKVVGGSTTKFMESAAALVGDRLGKVSGK